MGISTSISISCLLALCQFSSVSSSCAVVKCALPLCKPGEIQRTKPRECCSSCVPVRCAAVLCQPTVCMGSERTYTPPGECCPVCERGDLGTNRGCVHKGMSYLEGQSFKDSCNVCFCKRGKLICSKRKCETAEKPGVCPSSEVNIGMCAEFCATDSTCPGAQKCCSNGCGHQCLEPKINTSDCEHKGQNHLHGQSFRDDCNTCRCSNGAVVCTRKACLPKRKPGTCPRARTGVCAELCSSDEDCSSSEKCCSNGCGHQCLRVIRQ